MVHRQLSDGARAGGRSSKPGLRPGRVEAPPTVPPPARLAVAVALIAFLFFPSLGSAANKRVAISDYRWSQPDIQLDLGEHVTWYWTGPDTMHSVTGDSPNSETLDSDPQTGQPIHDIGDTFRLDFNTPGSYSFRCKLHSTVRGTVTVSDVPGDPASEPDPVPQSNVDRTAPRLRELSLAKPTFGKRGTNLRFSLFEASRVSAEFFRLDPDGKRRFAGYRTWKAFVGFNGVRMGGPSRHFKPRPGNYLAVVSATDRSQNTSADRHLKFTIREPK